MRMTSQQYACWMDKERQRELKKLAKTMPKPEPRPDHLMDNFMPLVNGKREKDLHNAVLAECLRRGWLCFHGSMAKRTSRTLGEPDIVCCADHGRVYFLELKSKDGKMRPEQLAIGAVLKRLGCQHHVVRSFADFLAVVDAEEPKA